MNRLLYFLLLIITLGCAQEPVKDLDDSQKAAFFYLYNKTLISDTFSRVLFNGPIDFRAIDEEQSLMYFVFDKTLNRAEAIMKIARDTSLVEFAPCESGMCNFGGLEGNVDDIYAVRIKLSNLNVDTNMIFRYELKSMKDSMTYAQLTAALDSNLYYGGKSFFKIKNIPYANIGTVVMKKNKKSSLYKLVMNIKGESKNQDEIVQKLVKLVTNEVAYSFADYWYNMEIMQRPHEVLLSGFADCSGKTVLLASLLEQLDIPYCILYYKNHVNVAVMGDFPNDNGYRIPIAGKKYAIAETTCKDFIMGRTILDLPLLPDLAFYQMPRESENIYDYKTEKKVSLYSQKEIEKMIGN